MSRSTFSGPLLSRGGFLSGSEAQPGIATVSKTINIPVAGAGANTDREITIPLGSRIIGMSAITGTAVTGAPTNVNLTVGSAFGGAQYVASVDIKAQGIFNLTQVTAGAAYFASTTGSLFVRLATVGGTAPTGSVSFSVEYAPPVVG
jgi:hypothetical protein